MRADPGAALAGYDLSDEERRGLAEQTGAADLRVDARVTKDGGQEGSW